MSANFSDGDRVSHSVKGLGTVRHDPDDDGLIINEREKAKAGPDMVYVVWDDDRFPVGKVPQSELEALPPGAAAISTGF